jgi:hypothetical protein
VDKMKRFPVLFVGIVSFMILAGCGSVYNPEAVGIDEDPNALKASPCACLQVETLPGLPEWFVS